MREIWCQARDAIESEARDLAQIAASLDPNDSQSASPADDLSTQDDVSSPKSNNRDKPGRRREKAEGSRRWVRPAWERFTEGVMGLDINALCNYGYSLWKEKKNVAGAERLLRRVLAMDPALPCRNITIGSRAECLSREQLVASGLEIGDIHAFLTHNMTEIFSRPAVRAALSHVLAHGSNSNASHAAALGHAGKGEESPPHELDYLRSLVEGGVPASQWLQPGDVHEVYSGVLDLPDSIPHPDGPDGRVAYARALCAMGEIALNFYEREAEAEVYLQQALQLDPENALAKCWWGVCILRSGGALAPGETVAMPGGNMWTRDDFVDKAEEFLLAAARLQPTNPVVVGCASCFLIEEREQYDIAQDLLQQALQLEPSEPELYHAYSLLQLKGGAAAAQALATTEGARAAQELLRTCEAEAGKAWRMALALHPAHLPSVCAFSSWLFVQQQYAAAEQLVKTALRIHPNSAALLLRLAHLKRSQLYPSAVTTVTARSPSLIPASQPPGWAPTSPPAAAAAVTEPSRAEKELGVGVEASGWAEAGARYRKRALHLP